MESPRYHLHTSDIRGVVRLAAQATVGTTQIVEGVHQSIWETLGMPGGGVPGQTRGITGLVYKSIYGLTRLVGWGLDSALVKVESGTEIPDETRTATPERETVIAALNGVMGDHLAATKSPFAVPMSLRYRGETMCLQSRPPLSGATGKVLLLVHGLCMNDLHWQASDNGADADYGRLLASRLGYTPVYLRYNSGLHISNNGRELSAQLAQLVAHWPVPIEELSIVAHSMGGLLTRSAIHYAQRDALDWVKHLRKVVFLGTPHHGSPLERAGNWVETIFGVLPFAAPLAKVAELRSAGITDLRYGSIVDGDWSGRSRFDRNADDRVPVPLPDGVACYAVAATTTTKDNTLSNRMIGDGLVPLDSALGRHDDPSRNLMFANPNQSIVRRTNHMELLRSPEVGSRLIRWLQPE